MKYLKLLALFTVFNTYAFGQVLDSEKIHYFDKYIEGVFKTIESPPAECLKLLEESDESKMLANKDLVKCYTLIEKEIPKQLKFDILSYRPKEKKRAEAIKNQAIIGTCYRKDSSSKYYAQLFADLESKPNKSPEENIYIANINSHCINLHSMYFETDYIMKERKAQKRERRWTNRNSAGVVITTTIITLVSAIIYINNGYIDF